MKLHSAMKRVLAGLLLCALACACLPPARAEAPASAPLKEGATQNGMVRVRLSSLGTPAALNLTVIGSYTVNGQSEKQLASGSTVTVKYSGGVLYLTSNGVTASMGTSFRLRRHASDGQNGVKIAQGRVPGNLYPGDLQFTVKNGAYYIICYVYMEDYLCGVLPYEMGAASPLEALKAQAVAARTYTMRAMQNSASSLYDVVDTTGDQVYNGTPAASSACTRAVNETKGIVLKNGDAFTATYYTASNGGQTESLRNAWNVSGYTYLTVKDDPYDLMNPDARKQSFFVSSSGKQTNATLASLLSQKAAAVFGQGAEITSVTAVTPHTPKFASPSRLYTKLDFSVNYTRNGASLSGTLTFDIFKELESPLGMSINSGQNELWSVTSVSGGFTVTARRYGHGLGMSQRGAMQMASLGCTCAQILGFYFQGCTMVRYTLTRSILSAVIPGQASREQTVAESPAPLPTDAPTSVPTSLTARVNTAQGSLNLRESPKSSAKVLRTIPQFETVSVLEKGDAWCRVTYAGTTGYVMTGFLSFIGDAAPTATPTPAATPAPTAAPSALTAWVNTAQGSLNLRESPKSNAKVLRTVPQYETVSVLEKGDAWCRVTYAGTTGYVMTGFLSFAGSAPAPTAAVAPTTAPSTVTAWVNTAQGSLNLREYPRDTAKVLRTVPQYATVTVLLRGSEWCRAEYAGQTGYVMTRFLSFTGQAPAVTPAPAATPASTSGDAAWVNTPQGSLNLRESPRDTAKVLTTIPQYAAVIVLERGGAWCRVVYEGREGYVMTKFLSTGGASPSATAAPSGGVPLDPTLRTLDLPVIARVMPEDKRLNLRAGCSTSSKVLWEMPKYDYLKLIAVGDTWCQVEYEGKAGYCMTKYLEYTLYE